MINQALAPLIVWIRTDLAYIEIYPPVIIILFTYPLDSLLILIRRNIRCRSIINGMLTLSIPESSLESNINVVVPFEFVDKTPVCDHSNESYRAVFQVVLFGFGIFAK